MLNDSIKALIRDLNPWWEKRELKLPEYKRHAFSEIQKYMKTRQIIAIIGLRRVGKTILMKQIIKKIIAETGKGEDILYFSFDDIMTQNPEILNDVLEYFLKTVPTEGKKHIFLDEIQKVPYWQDTLKRFYDMRDDVKFVVSGSASLKIRKSKESLAGRIFDFHLPILTFREFLELNEIKIDKAELRFDSLKNIYEKNLHKKPTLEKMLSDYILKGAFPEIVKETDEDIIKNYVKNSVVENIVLGDIPATFGIKRKDILYSVVEYCSKETSNLLDITNLSKTLGVNYLTIRTYIFYIEKSFLIDMVYNYSKSIAKQLRKNKKVHIAHPSITIAMMRYSKNILEEGEMVGRYVETVVFQHSKLLSERLSFWRSPQKEEVDIILENQQLLPIEVKYRTAASDTRNILKFMKKYKLKRGIVVTKDVLEERKFDGAEIIFIPAWLFLLVV